MLENPLTPPERRAVVRLVEASDPTLAARLERELQEDPIVTALVGVVRETGQDVRNEVRSMRTQMVGLLGLMMILQTVLVGGAVTLSGGGFSLSTSARAATSSVDVVEDRGAGPSDQPADPQL